MSIFLLRKNVRVQALTDSVKIRWLMQKILDFLSCDLTTPYRSELPSLHDRNKIAYVRPVNN